MDKEEDDLDPIAAGAITGIAKFLLSQEVKVKNYYLFSISYIHLEKRNKTLNTGLAFNSTIGQNYYYKNE